MPIIYDEEKDLRERARKSLSDDFKHQAIENAQEAFFAKRAKLVEELPDWEDIRTRAAAIRTHVSRNLDYYVREFAQNAQASGAILHFAPTGEDALADALDIFEAHHITHAVKTKSMMTEEIGLNEALAEVDIPITETDCAEHILQTAQDKPSHIVVPALHFDRRAIAELYREKRGYEGSEDPEEITRFLRKILRSEFLDAPIGVRGCNFAVASTGSVTLVTNEGNGRMVDTFPPVQIIFVGIDRIVPDLESLDTMMALLPRSAVGAKMTAYFTLDTGAARPDEADGPREVHIIIMDNKRSRMLGDDFEDMMRCIRCGACLNICPVYRHITGHGYGSIYPGPMGIVLTGALEGYENIGSLASACTLCGACTDHCPVKIPLHDLIREHRIRMVDEGYTTAPERAVFKGLELFWSNQSIFKLGLKAGRPVMKAMAHGSDALGASSAKFPVLSGWTSSRDFDVISKERFSDWFREHKAQEKKTEVDHD